MPVNEEEKRRIIDLHFNQGFFLVFLFAVEYHTTESVSEL